MKRYELDDVGRFESIPVMAENANGEWVRYQDIKELLDDAARYRWMKANEHSRLAMELCMEVPAEDWDAAEEKK
jgi:hypothetical protein